MFLSAKHPLTLSILLACSLPLSAETILEPVVVVAPATATVLTVETDPKAPRQPVPAHDGADLLKSIPGFAVIRKGGTDGDPLFRGMAASRLSILLDGETILGGCGNRMDPPTAYVFPEEYDSVTVLKGPQSVQHASGSSAGTVMFERAAPDFRTDPVQGYVSLLGASFGRNDQVTQILAGGDKGYIRLNGTRSDAGNYEDGDGHEVHSAYTRWSTSAQLGWTPDQNRRIELSAARSDGEAAYGDRSMDGTAFDRTNLGLSAEQYNLSPLISRLKARLYHNYVDHVMDNYSLRYNAPGANMMTGEPANMVSNPDRDTQGGTLITTLDLAGDLQLDVGVEHQRNQHSLRKASDPLLEPDYRSQPRVEDMRFTSNAVFAEAVRRLDSDHSLHGGLRMTRDEADDLRSGKTTSNDSDNRWLTAAFARYEQQLNPSTRTYAGLGYTERAADYWERTRNPEATSAMVSGTASTFALQPEKTTQLDAGLIHSAARIKASVSAFYARHDDYILIEKLNMFATDARNVRATTLGTEADIAWQLTPQWTSTSTLAWVYGTNDSEDRALGQMPAPELRLGLNYAQGQWSAGGLWRGVAQQSRVAVNQGNIVGQDIGATGAYAVVSLHAGYRAGENLLVTAGIDNLFDRTYAEHISRNGASIEGYETTTRINEAGRNLWLKAQYNF